MNFNCDCYKFKKKISLSITSGTILNFNNIWGFFNYLQFLFQMGGFIIKEKLKKLLTIWHPFIYSCFYQDVETIFSNKIVNNSFSENRFYFFIFNGLCFYVMMENEINWSVGKIIQKLFYFRHPELRTLFISEFNWIRLVRTRHGKCGLCLVSFSTKPFYAKSIFVLRTT